MMFSRDAMTASATEADTPPRMASTTNKRLRLGVMSRRSGPSPTRGPRAPAPPRAPHRRPTEQHEAEQHGQHGPEHAARHGGFAEFNNRGPLVQRVPPHN